MKIENMTFDFHVPTDNLREDLERLLDHGF